MALNYTYHYAEFEIDTGLCIGVFSTTTTCSGDCIVEIPVYDDEYIDKYYIDGNWYEDAEGTIPWTSSML